MTVEEAIRARVLAIPAVVAAVGSRVYTLTFPQNPTWPAIRIQEVSEVEEYHLRGPIGIRRARVQLDIVATTFTAAAAIDRDVRGTFDANGLPTGLSGFFGVIAGSPPFKIAAVLADGGQSLYDPEELAVVRLANEFAVFWREG